MKISHERVVDAFNDLGYHASFAAVAKKFRGIDAKDLYRLYPSREALGEAWLSSQKPPTPGELSVYSLFSCFTLTILRSLEDYRDFSRMWLAAITATGGLHLPQLRDFHDSAATYFLAGLDAFQSKLSFPNNVRYEDVRLELSDAMVALVLGFMRYWQSDRSITYAHTLKLVDAVSYLLDALLMRRDDFGHASLLVHLHTLVGEQQERFLRPLLDILIKPERAGRFADPISLLEVLRTLQASPARRT